MPNSPCDDCCTLGLRYRVDVAPLAGLRRRADLVFSRARIAVFVEGCFWHSCSQHARDQLAGDGPWGSQGPGKVVR